MTQTDEIQTQIQDRQAEIGCLLDSIKQDQERVQVLYAEIKELKKIALPDMGLCMEPNCAEKAVADYNGKGYFVCEDCNDSLNRHFDNEYHYHDTTIGSITHTS